MLSFSKPQSYIGADISAGSIKLMQIRKDRKSFQLKAFARGALPKGAVINDQIVDKKTFNYILKQTLDKPQFGHFDSLYANICVPESKSFLRVIQMPKMSEVESEAAVPYEAESFIPLPVDQVYLDWQKLSDNGDKSNILIIATPKEYVDMYLEVMDLGGLKPAALEAESQSLCRSLVDWKLRETALLLDIDASRSNLVMVESGHLQFSSTVPIAGAAFTESLARSLGVASVKAEEIKKKAGMQNTAEYPNVKIALAPILNNLTAEIKNVLKFHSERSEAPIEKIILAGGGSKLKSLAEIMQVEFAANGNVKVELGNPWRNLENMTTQALTTEDSLSWCTAAGLAMRSYEKL